MKNEEAFLKSDFPTAFPQELFVTKTTRVPRKIRKEKKDISFPILEMEPAEILFMTSYPPRECGIATYSQDLISAINNKFNNSLAIKVCALESGESDYAYPSEVKFILNTSLAADYTNLSKNINTDPLIKLVVIQHEFGFFKNEEQTFLRLLYELSKPVIIVFHTVLPNPDGFLKSKIRSIAIACSSIIVMTHNSAQILIDDYDISKDKINVIAHGTHLVQHLNEKFLKTKYGFQERKVLTTFGLLSSGKSIETTLDALPTIIKQSPDVLFLIIGKTHPEVVKTDGEKYRESLLKKVKQHKLHDHVLFINNYLALPDLLEYLQLTDIYIFTTNDPNQAVSGTFAYAMSCGCPIISTPIPHAKEFLTDDTGIIFNFRNSSQLADAVIRLFNDEQLRKNISSNTLQKIVSTAWENSAVSHAMLFGQTVKNKIQLQYNLPEINLNHLKRMTTKTGLIQFSKINQPDISSGFTLDDNARALIAMCMYFKLKGKKDLLNAIQKYLDFIKLCQQPAGNFLNYVNEKNKFTEQNNETNLNDSNGRAVWALGYLISLNSILPQAMVAEAKLILDKSLLQISTIHSTRAMAFAIKGLFYYQKAVKSKLNLELLKTFANRMVQMFKHESRTDWKWFEGYLTYANSVLPEAMLYAWLLTHDSTYKYTAQTSLNFLLSETFNDKGIEVISNKSWLKRGEEAEKFGEQPIDVAYTIMTLGAFYNEWPETHYKLKMEKAFNWFLGDNRLRHIVYNPCTGGCYDGLEEKHVNLNQGAESTISYLLARLTMENLIHEN